MLSKNCADWIKISEMLLGRVPEGFRFEPKHKGEFRCVVMVVQPFIFDEAYLPLLSLFVDESEANSYSKA